MDIFYGTEIIDGTMRFRETEAINDNFELFGIENKNFMLNSGSYFIIQIGLVGYFLGRWLINKLAVRYAHSPTARKIGMWAYEAQTWLKMKTAYKKLFMESYFDLLFCSFINLIALVETTEIGLFFKRRDDFISSVITIVYVAAIFMFPVYVSVMILRNFAQLEENRVKEQHGIFYDGVNTKTRGQALYNVFFMMRRLATVAVLIFFRDVPFFQCQFLMLFSVTTFIYVSVA